MNLVVLNTDLEAIQIIDDYESLIWTDRYNEAGEFELYGAMDVYYLTYIAKNNYIQSPNSDHTMIIDSLHIQADAEGTNCLIVTGKSLEYLLARRIIWGQQQFTGSFQDCIYRMLYDAFMNPGSPERYVPNFRFSPSTDPGITSLTMDEQHTGDNLYDVISEACAARSVGFKIVLNDANEFVFSLFLGTDRSYAQDANPYVIFSPRFENVITSEYRESNLDLCTVALIGGEGDGSARVYAQANASQDTGLYRRELFVDARDLSSNPTGDAPIQPWEYQSLLTQRGIEKLSEQIETTSFEGQTETTIMFKYGTDFFIGDIVEVENEYGHEARARITELITNEDKNGSYTYPTFETVKES